MEYEALKDALDGLHAYDTGAVDSGIHDEVLREKVKAYLQSLPSKEHRTLLARLTWDLCLSPASIEHGYGPEDAKEFLVWMDETMGCLIAG